MKSSTLKIRIQTVMLDELKPQIQEYAQFWSPLADEVCYLDYKLIDDDLQEGLDEIEWACPQLWQRMTILWDGTILPCNEDEEAKGAIGNVQDITIEEVWNGERLNTLRQKHKRGNSGKTICAKCFFRKSEIQKISNKIKERA